MYILANMWFTKLIMQFFFWLDKIVYNFISSIYDLLITIARTSILTQADIADMSSRIYKLLAIFMIFKVTLSLITYVVNPDDFSDKSKGVSKLGINIVISLSVLILTPYIFNYAYQFQTIILEDNSLATLIFGGEKDEKTSFFNTAGDDMAYITMSAFLTPNLSLGDLHECSVLLDSDTKKFNGACKTAMENQTGDNFSEQTLKTYIGGVENSSLEMLFRQDLVLATDPDNESFIMDYKFVFSTVVGVVIILLLITFCMDVAVRSIKLAFLQLIAPIPILSYVDPKSGKDGLFKKWYEMCLKTFLSLFVRLIALYFAVYIISKVADMKMVDLVDGSYQTNALVAIFIIIGALMFAKQLPKILEGLGIKLDGDGKFFLNPLRKMEKEALGGGILKKPNDMLAKAGKAALLSPFTTASLGGRKLMAGIDSAANGKGFWNGTKNVKSKMAQGIDKFKEKNLPHTYQKEKDVKAGRESLALKDQMYKKGEKLYQQYTEKGKKINDAFKNEEYRKSYDNVDEQKKKMYHWQQEVEKRKSSLSAAEIELANAKDPEAKKAAQSKVAQCRLDLETAMTNSGKAQAQYELSKAKHEDIKKIYRDDAEIEDSHDFYMKNNGYGLAEEKKYSPSADIGSNSSSDDNGSDSSSDGGDSGTSSSDGDSGTSSDNSQNSSTNGSSSWHSPEDYDERIDFENQRLIDLMSNGASSEEIEVQEQVVRSLHEGKKNAVEREANIDEANETFNDGWMSQGRANIDDE